MARHLYRRYGVLAETRARFGSDVVAPLVQPPLRPGKVISSYDVAHVRVGSLEPLRETVAAPDGADAAVMMRHMRVDSFEPLT